MAVSESLVYELCAWRLLVSRSSGATELMWLHPLAEADIDAFLASQKAPGTASPWTKASHGRNFKHVVIP